MVGLINTSVTTFELVFVLLLNIHFNTGILESKGMPDALSSFSVLSIPPNTIISSLLTLMLLSNLLVAFGGGDPSDGIDVKSEISILIPKVTWSSPETCGLIAIVRFASVGVYTLVSEFMVVADEGIRF